MEVGPLARMLVAKNPTLLDDTSGKVISSIKQVSRNIKISDGEYEQETTTEYKLNNKNTSIDQLCKILGFYEKDNTQKPGTTANIIIDKEVVQGVLKSFDDKY